MVYHLSKKLPVQPTEEDPRKRDKNYRAAETQSYVIRQSFVGANTAPDLLGENLLEGVVNYMVGDRSKWVQSVKTYGNVRYR
ncbi:MAG: hypothetical protein AB7J46_00440 [Candidatus Altimarinota bacterium]